MKKPKPKKKEVLSASNVKDYLRNKFDLNCDDFWDWFFSECDYGDTNFLSMDIDDVFEKSWLEYIKTIKDEFHDKKEDEYNLEIENDL